MKADKRKIELAMARNEKRRIDIKVSSSSMQKIYAGQDVQPQILGKVAKDLGVDIEEILKEEKTAWTPINKALPEPGKYVLLSFEKYPLPSIGRYEEDEKGGAFYPEDGDTSYCTRGIFANAWMPLPKPYRGDEEHGKSKDKPRNP